LESGRGNHHDDDVGTEPPRNRGQAAETRIEINESLDPAILDYLLEVCTPAEPELYLFFVGLHQLRSISDPEVRSLVRDKEISYRRFLREERYRLDAEADERDKLLAERLATASYDNSNSAGTFPQTIFFSKYFHLICRIECLTESGFFSTLCSWFTSSTPDEHWLSRAALVQTDEATLLLPDSARGPC
jgi:hypothetical protein